MRQRPVTLRDVAQVANVSVSTASKALNDRDEVAAATRQRVKEAAAQLRFSPNPMAQGLLPGRTRTVGILTGDLEGRFVLPILMGAEDALGVGQINAFLCDARGDSIREQHHLQALLSRRVDGIIVVGKNSAPRVSLGSNLGVPVIYVYMASDGPEDFSIISDDEQGGRLQVEHLLSLGRKKLAHVSGDPTYYAAQSRAIGVLGAASDAGLSLVAEPVFSEWSQQWGRDAAAMLLRQHPDIDGFICGSDQLACGVIDTLRDLGRHVPGDVSVVGYDNWDVLAQNSRPPLTTIDPSLENLGREAALQIIQAIDGEEMPIGVRRLPTNLVIRRSTVPGADLS